MVLNASALPLHHSDLLVYTLYYRREETKYNRSEWCSGRALAFKPTGRGFAPRQSLSFSHVDVSIYQSYISGLPPASALSFSHVDVGPTPLRPDVSCISYYRREETTYNRLEWCRGKALAFKTIGRGFAPRQPFLFFRHRRRRRVSIYKSYTCCYI